MITKTDERPAMRTTIATGSLPSVPRKPLSLFTLFRWLADRNGLHRSRLRLAVLDDHLLRDIGVSREAARTEADRKGWDAPDHWQR